MKSIVLCVWTRIFRAIKSKVSTLTLCALIIFGLFNGTKISFAHTYNVIFKVTKLGASIVAEPAVSQYGMAVTLRAKVEGRQPTGQVHFYDDGKKIGEFTLTAEHDGVATLVVTKPPLRVGQHKISAHYQSDQHAAVNDIAEVIVEVNPADQTIDLVAPSSCIYGQQDCAIQAQSNTEEPITYTSDTPDICTINTQGLLQIKQSGSCTINVTQAENDNYRPAQQTIKLSINRATTNLSGLTSWQETYKQGKTLPLPTKPKSESSGKITYSIPEAQHHIATINADTGKIALHGVGQATITAKQESDNQYDASETTATLTVIQGAAQLTWISDRSEVYAPNKPINLDKPTSASSGTYTYTSSNPHVATIDQDGKVTLQGVGATTLTAYQNAAGNYSGGQTAFQLSVTPADQTIDLVAPSSCIYGQQDCAIQAQSNTEEPITYTSDTPDICTINTQGLLQIKQSGSCTINVTQAENDNYRPAQQTIKLSINRATTNLSGLTSWQETYKQGKTLPLPTKPKSESSGKITYSIPEAQHHIATINADTGKIALHGVGRATIIAKQESDNQYDASETTATLTVTRAMPTWTLHDRREVFGVCPFNLGLKRYRERGGVVIQISESNGHFTYTSSDQSVAMVDGHGDVVVYSAGETLITVTQAAYGHYAERTVSFTLTVIRLGVSLNWQKERRLMM